MLGRRREQWGRADPWGKKMREVTERARSDLEKLGEAYAQQVPALQALLTGQTPAPLGDDSWQAPARALLVLERRRLALAGH